MPDFFGDSLGAADQFFGMPPMDEEQRKRLLRTPPFLPPQSAVPAAGPIDSQDFSDTAKARQASDTAPVGAQTAELNEVRLPERAARTATPPTTGSAMDSPAFNALVTPRTATPADRFNEWESRRPEQPEAQNPSLKRRALEGLTTAGAALVNPLLGRVVNNLWEGPQYAAQKRYGQARQAWEDEGKGIVQGAQLADIASQTAERQRNADKPITVESGGQAYERAPDGSWKAIGSPKAGGEEDWSTAPGVTGPNGEPVQQEKHSGQYRIAPLPGATVVERGAANRPSEQDKEVADYLAAHNLPDTPANREKARAQVRAELRPPAPPKPGPTEGAFDRTMGEGAAKDMETARGGDFRYRSMAGSVDKAKQGDQQAMVNLLTNHIGMTLGMQKGARITKDILREAQNSSPWLQGLKAKWGSDGYMTGVTLTPQQMDQMMGLAVSQRANAWAQAVESARQAGVADKLKIPGDVRIRVVDAQGKPGTIPANKLSEYEDHGYTVAAQ